MSQKCERRLHVQNYWGVGGEVEKMVVKKQNIYLMFGYGVKSDKSCPCA
jgi:hypothetical protein